MRAHHTNLINALTLVLCGAWGYWATDFKSLTALIPVAFGIALVACNSGVKAENKVIAHIAVLLTIVLLIAIYAPLRSALDGGEPMSLLRVSLMIASSVLAMVFFVKSFRDARHARQSG
ncbi:MAG: hypothetical protein AAGB07_19560 [Pseudomonadota bacterium]